MTLSKKIEAALGDMETAKFSYATNVGNQSVVEASKTVSELMDGVKVDVTKMLGIGFTESEVVKTLKSATKTIKELAAA